MTEAKEPLDLAEAPTPQKKTAEPLDVNKVFAGGGETGRLLRSMDWSTTPVGAPETWPYSLRTTVSLILNSRYPMFVFWGPALVAIYNDGYRPILAAKHPWALGKPAREVWPEIWDVIGPMIDVVINKGESTWSADLLFFMERNGYPEECYFTFSYSPVRDESGEVGGMFCACIETTEKVVSDRRMRTLRDLARAPMEARSVDEACSLSCDVLSQNAGDIPFALLYLIEPSGDEARLAASAGTEPDDVVCPALIKRGDESPWRFFSVADERATDTVIELSGLSLRVPQGPWPEPPIQALVLPLIAQGQDRAVGILILGVGSRRTFDATYRDFFSLVTSQIATSVAKVRAFEEERRRAEALAEIDRAKTAFFSNVSHEFRTPLTLMLGPTEELLSGACGALSDDQRSQLELLRRNELRLQRLVNALLEFSRIEAGRVQATYEPVDLAALTRDLASSFRAAVERAGLAFKVDCPPLDEPVFVDRNMWEQIVLNLLSNAFKFTFDGAIEVSLRADEATDGRVTLSVSDSGVGVRPEDLPRVFERFHRIEGTRARTHEGSGIGLALVQELVRLHGGAVQASSVWGKGTTFKVSIPKGFSHLQRDRVVLEPRAQKSTGAAAFVEEALRWMPDDDGVRRSSTVDADADAGTSAGTGTGAGAGAGTGTGTGAGTGAGTGRRADGKPARSAKRVLVADDNADMRMYLRRILEERWQVELASDGAVALAAIRERAPDLVVTDVMMPVLDGFELARELLRDPSTATVPIIMLSARAGDESRVDGLSAGAVDYLVKPFTARELVARVQTHIELGELRKDAAKQAADLRAAAALRDEFLSLASHELRTPLMSLSMLADRVLKSLRDEAPTPASAEKNLERMQTLRSQATRLEQAIEGTFDVFANSEDRSLNLEVIDLSDVVRSVVDRVHAERRASNGPILLRTEPMVGSWDGRRVEQIVHHLLSNALKFGGGQPIEVTVGGSEERAHITVEDGGIGIAVVDQERIFGRFARAASSREYSGFGVGLWMVKELTRAMGGDVHVKSQPGEGATFTVELPRSP